MNTPVYNETDHPRSASGQWATKPHSEADIDLGPVSSQIPDTGPVSYETSGEVEASLSRRLAALGIDSDAVDMDSMIRDAYIRDQDGWYDPRPGFDDIAALASKHRWRTQVARSTTVVGGKTYTLRRTGTLPKHIRETLVRASRPVTNAEIARMTRAAQYAWRSGARGAKVGSARRIDEYTFAMPTNISQSNSADDVRATSRWEDQFRKVVSEGSRLRTTDRSGPGTAGTRLVEPLPDPPRMQMYYDSVEDGGLIQPDQGQGH